MRIYYRPGIQNGHISKRSPGKIHAALPARSARLPRLDGSRQLHVLLLLVGAGAAIAAGFVFSLHQHFTASAIGREEVRLKANIDQLYSEQRHLELKRTHALSPGEVEREARRQGRLGPLKLDQPEALRAASAAAKPEKASRRVETMSIREIPSTQPAADAPATEFR